MFQGDVEAVASQSPQQLSRLIEQISGSLELAGEYEKAKADQDRATENATFNFTKRRGIAGEIKQYKEQKGEAERFEALCKEKVRRVITVLYVYLSGGSGRTRSPPDPVQALLYSTVPRRTCAGNQGAEQDARRATTRATEAREGTRGRARRASHGARKCNAEGEEDQEGGEGARAQGAPVFARLLRI